MSMYAKYMEELYRREVYEDEKGFIAFKAFHDNSLLISALYIKPEYRGERNSSFYEKVALDKYPNTTSITCYVDTTTENPTQSLKCILSNGYHIVEFEGKQIVLEKLL